MIESGKPKNIRIKVPESCYYATPEEKEMIRSGRVFLREISENSYWEKAFEVWLDGSKIGTVEQCSRDEDTKAPGRRYVTSRRTVFRWNGVFRNKSIYGRYIGKLEALIDVLRAFKTSSGPD